MNNAKYSTLQELLLSEKWARLHKIKFPNVKEQVKEYIDQPIQECYVFKVNIK